MNWYKKSNNFQSIINTHEDALNYVQNHKGVKYNGPMIDQGETVLFLFTLEGGMGTTISIKPGDDLEQTIQEKIIKDKQIKEEYERKQRELVL